MTVKVVAIRARAANAWLLCRRSWGGLGAGGGLVVPGAVVDLVVDGEGVALVEGVY